MSITCTLSYDTPSYTPRFAIEQYVCDAATLLHITQAHFSITFIDDAAMCALHNTYLNIPTTTDIMTFNLETITEPLGDIYICIDDAKRNALDENWSLDNEIKTLILHGILHCIGYTDTSPTEKKRMFTEQDRLYALLS